MSNPASGARRPVISEPHKFPVVQVDKHLPAISPERLQAQVLRQQLAQAHLSQPSIAGDGLVLANGQASGRAAAVLIALVQRPQGLQVLLTRRTAHLRNHAGQISFPGGRSEPDDADATATALRESQEEVGLEPSGVEIIGQLPRYLTVTGYAVTPVVGLLMPPEALRADPHEVDEVFEVPLAFLMNPANHRHHRFEYEGGERLFLSMPWTAPGGVADAYFIWGATAAMLRNLYAYLASLSE